MLLISTDILDFPFVNMVIFVDRIILFIGFYAGLKLVEETQQFRVEIVHSSQRILPL